MTKLTNDEQRVDEFCARLEELTAEFPEFKVFISIFSRDGGISWTITESLCMACIVDWLIELKEARAIKHLEEGEMIH